MSEDAKFDVISYLKSLKEPSSDGYRHPSTSAVRSWCYRQSDLLTMTKRGDSGKLVALAPESLRTEVHTRFTSRPRPKNPRKRKAASIAPINDVRHAAEDLANKLKAAECARTEAINAAIEAADNEYRKAVEAATESCKHRALAISPPQAAV
jgi:hypothetical protein